MQYMSTHFIPGSQGPYNFIRVHIHVGPHFSSLWYYHYIGCLQGETALMQLCECKDLDAGQLKIKQMLLDAQAHPRPPVIE